MALKLEVLAIGSLPAARALEGPNLASLINWIILANISISRAKRPAKSRS
jgi:hypothetical protein